jgi:hypothetical protein
MLPDPTNGERTSGGSQYVRLCRGNQPLNESTAISDIANTRPPIPAKRAGVARREGIGDFPFIDLVE